MLPGVHNTHGNLALTPAGETGALELLNDAPAPANGARLMEHTLEGIVDLSDMEAILQPIREATGAYARHNGPGRDLAWEKMQWMVTVEAETLRGRTEEEAVQATLLKPADRWPHLISGGKHGGDQRCLPNFRRWRRKVGRDKAGRIKQKNWGTLVKRRGGGQIAQLDADFMRAFFSLYLHPNAPDIEPTRRNVARKFRLLGRPDAVASPAQVRRAVDQYVTRTMDMKYRAPRNVFNNLVRGWINREVNAEPGEIFFMDHRICDFWVRTTNEAGEAVAVRPWITAVFDARSFVCIKAIIYVDSNPNHERILEALQEAIRRAGNRPPRVLYVDNGKDFLKMGLGTPLQLTEKQNAGRALCRDDGSLYEYSVCGALGITVKTARGYNGKEKPIERWFRDMARDWEKTRLGYCGNSPATRPDYGDTWQGDVGRLETVGQAMASLDAWIAKTANRHPLEDGMTRGEMWAGRNAEARPRFEDLDLFVRMLLPQRVAPLVRRSSMGGGVAFAGWQYSHADLHEYWDQPLMVKTCWFAPRVTRPVRGRSGKVHREVPACVFVFTLDDRLICGAIADPVFEMFAESDEEKARIGAAQHLINAVAKRDSDRFRELTGRQKIADPSKILAELEEDAQSTVALSADPSEPNRRLRSAGKAAAEPVQELRFDAAEDMRDVFDEVVFGGGKRIQEEHDDESLMDGMEF